MQRKAFMKMLQYEEYPNLKKTNLWLEIKLKPVPNS